MLRRQARELFVSQVKVKFILSALNNLDNNFFVAVLRSAGRS